MTGWARTAGYAILAAVALVAAVDALRNNEHDFAGRCELCHTTADVVPGGPVSLKEASVIAGQCQQCHSVRPGTSHPVGMVVKAKLPEWVFRFTPAVGEQGSTAGGVLTMTFAAFVAYIGVQWWASWYPGGEPGGGGYIAQRMMSDKDEKHSLFATLWFTIAHYAVRPWPWIIVALVSLVLYPELDWAHKGDGFVMVMRDYLPAGLLGLLMAAFLAAYMSTIATQLNWGASYLVNDFYRRFIKPVGGEKYYVRVSRITTVLTMIISLLITSQLSRISGAW